MRKLFPPRWWRPVAAALLTFLLARPGAAQITQYSFSALSEPYVPLSASATIFSISGGVGDADTGHSLALPLSFTFPFGSTSSSSVIVDADGWLTPSGTANQNVFLNVLNSTQDEMIAFFGRDLHQGNATFSYQTAGVAPNRIFKMQGANIGQYNQATSQPIGSGNVQVWLYESGRIEFHYGVFSTAFTTPSFTTTQVGLRGTGTTDVRSITGTWSAPTASTSSTAAMPLSATEVPVNGSMFRFDPPAGLDITPPTIGTVTVMPPGGACAATAHTVSVTPTDASGIASASVSYSVNGGTPVVLPMTNSGGTYSAIIPAQGASLVGYSVTVVDASQQTNSATSPSATYADVPVSVSAGPDQMLNTGSTATLTATEASGLGLKITEYEFTLSGSGRTSPLPSYIGSSDFDLVEITNTGAATVDLAGYRFALLSPTTGAAQAYTFPSGATVPAGAVLVLHIGTGADSPANRYYHTQGADDPFFSANATAGLLLLTPGGVAFDGVALNGFDVAANFPAGIWSGAGVVTSSSEAGAALTGPDTNDATNWTVASATSRLTIGTLNTGLPLRTLPTVTWTGGNLSAPSTANPLTTPAFTAAGTYTFTASYTQSGCTVTDDVTVTVQTPQLPVANFSASATSVTSTTVVTFTDLSTNLPMGWQWSFTPNTVTFVNGTSATSQNPQVTFNSAGTYTVALTASNAAGSDTETKPGYITVQLTYCTTNLQSSACSSFSSPINSVSIAGTPLSNLNNGCSDALGNSYSVFPANGATTATLTAGQTYSLTVTSASTGTIAAWLDTNANGTFEMSEFILVTGVGQGPTPSTSTVPFTVPSTATPGQVRLRIRNSASGSATGTIAAGDACVLRFTGETEDYVVTLVSGCNIPAPVPTSNSPVCVGGTINFSATNVPNGATYAWTGPNSFTSSSATPSIPSATLAAAGTYSLVVSLNGCDSPAGNVTATVNPAQSAAFAYGSNAYCLDAPNPTPTISGTAGGTFSAPIEVALDAATGAIDLASSSAGTYTVRYTTGGPCTALDSVSITLVAPPAAMFSYEVAGPVCSNSGPLTPMLDAGSGATAGTFTATPAGLVIDAATGAVNVGASAPGSYVVTNTVTGTSPCMDATAAATLSIETAPTVSLGAGGPTTFCEGGSVILTASGGDTYEFFQDGQSVGSGSTFTATQTGSYTATTTNTAGCSASSAPVTVTVMPVQSAAFAYASNVVCLSGLNPTPTVTGVAGGTFSADNGLPIDFATGAIDLTNATAGTYVVTYVTPGPCAGTATQSLTLTTLPSAHFAYGTGELTCTGQPGTLTPLLNTDAVAGTFTATPATGLTLNPTTGVIDLATSTAGVYVIYNNVAASGSCAAALDSVELTLEATPFGTIGVIGSASACVGDSVLLVATGGASYQFLLDGQPITGATNDSLYVAQSGDYSVTVMNTAGCSFTTAANTVVISPPQSAAFAYANSTLCLSGTIATPTITGTVGGTFSAPTGLTLAPLTGAIDLTASMAGTYTVLYTTPGPCAAIDSAMVTLTTAPLATFSYASGGPVCVGSMATLVPTLAAGATAGTFSATPAGLTLDPVTGVVTVATSAVGIYVVSNALAASGACAADTATTTLTIDAAPTASLMTVGAASFCAGDSVMLLASGGASYQFLLNGQPIGGATNDSLYATAAGNYAVVAMSAGGCANTSAVVAVTVNPVQSAAFAYTGSDFCVGGGLTPTPTVTGTTGGTFSSTTGLALDAATGEINLATSVAGSYGVTYTTAGPCPGTSTQTVTLNASPMVAITGLNPTYCTADAAVTLAGTANGMAGGTFTIDGTPATVLDPGVLGAGTPVTVVVVFTGTSGGGCSASVSQTVTILPTPAQPTVTVSPQPSGIVILTSSIATGNQWLLNGVAITGATGATYAVTTSAQSGTYQVLNTTGPCPAGQSSSQNVTVTGTAADAVHAAGFELYPNPTADGQLRLELPAASTAQPLIVFDATGRAVYRTTLPANTATHSLDLRTLPIGVYSVRVLTPAGPAVRRLMRE